MPKISALTWQKTYSVFCVFLFLFVLVWAVQDFRVAPNIYEKFRHILSIGICLCLFTVSIRFAVASFRGKVYRDDEDK